MSAADELSDLVYAEALTWVPLGGGINQVERVGRGVLINGGQPPGLLGMFSPATCVQIAVSDGAVHAIILGGRQGVPVEQELFTMQVGARPLADVASEAVRSVASYLATSTG